MRIFYNPELDTPPRTGIYSISGNELKFGECEVDKGIKDNPTFNALVERGVIKVLDEPEVVTKKTVKSKTKADDAN